MENDIDSANENIAEARSGVAKLQQELEKLKKELSKSEVGWHLMSSHTINSQLNNTLRIPSSGQSRSFRKKGPLCLGSITSSRN